METESKIVYDDWDVYFTDRHNVPMTISFDDGIARGDRPLELNLCARIIIHIKETKEGSSIPVQPESDLLYRMEDEITEQLQSSKVKCRLVGRMTYDGLREIVFQVGEIESFRPIVGRWIQGHKEYEIGVSEHDGWGFFDDFIQPNEADRRNMAEQRTIDNLIENGSDPDLPHSLEYCFRGKRNVLESIVDTLIHKGYRLLEEQNLDEGRVVLSKSMTLDKRSISAESESNEALAHQLGGELDGWGALVVSKKNA
ncbi:MAG: DUF695 domain-containing protein [Verrucomicrobiota bacterium]